MGAMCVSKEEKLQMYERKRKAQQYQKQIRQTLNNCVYSQKVRKYVELYGREVKDETKQFIEKNYNYNYNSEVKGPNYPRQGTLTLTYKSSLIDRFETAYKNGNRADKLQLIKLDTSNNRLFYKFSIRTPQKVIYYDCQARFDNEDKFLNVFFNQYVPYVAQSYRPYVPQATPKNTYKQQSSNNYYGPTTDWNAHYNAEVARSNEQFRQNMNKQAQQWNNYATQKNNRGW